MGAGGHADVDFVRPRVDKLEYGHMQLQNGLEAILISDRDTDKASAALDVRVGSLSDPKDLPGLAHFLEHMLFYSNEKYPEEDAYSKFITEHGGHTNAFTASEDTNYYFEVNHDHLEPALDRFAQFFLCPLISEDGVSREANAVDSEHGKNVNTDAWRQNQIWRAAANEDHPYSYFHTGNLETLITRPAEKGISIHQAVRDFAAEKYSANLMRLVVYGRESIAELKQLVQSQFGDIEDKHLSAPRFAGDVIGKRHLQCLIKVVPQKESNSVTMQWPIPPQSELYQSLPCGFISHLLGHEGEGSVFAVLKAKGWATQLSTGEAGSSFSAKSFFNLTIVLTKDGQKHVPEVTSLVMAYIEMLRGPEGVTPERFEEMRALQSLRFDFSDKISPGRLTSAMSQVFQRVPAHHTLLALHNVALEYDEAGIKQVLDCLTPENVRMMWSSKDFQGSTDKKEQWYGTDYSLEALSDGWLQQWQQCGASEGLHLPRPNPFVSTDFSMLEGGLEKEDRPVPVLVQESKLVQLYYKQETSFGAPKAIIYLSFICPHSYSSPETAVLTQLYIRLLLDSLNELSYDAELAGLTYNVHNTTSGFLISFAGYNHKLMELVRHVLHTATELDIQEDRFEVQKELALKSYVNKKFEQPYQTALYTSSVIQEVKRWHVAEYEAVIGELSKADLEDARSKMLGRLKVQGYVTGNMRQQEAVEIADLVESLLQENCKSKPLFDSQLADLRVAKLQQGKPAVMKMPVPNSSNKNSAIMLSYQVGPDDVKRNGLAELWVRCTKQEAFHQLRSQQQLGYIVFLTTSSNLTVRSVAFILQSTAFPAAVLEERCEEFLHSAHTLLIEMSDSEFLQHVEELAKDKLEKPKRLGEKAAKEWREIEDGTSLFDRPEKEVAALHTLAKDDLLTFFQECVYDPSKRRKLGVLVEGMAEESEIPQQTHGETAQNGSQQKEIPKAGTEDRSSGEKTSASGSLEVITDIWAFRRRQELYPSCR